MLTHAQVIAAFEYRQDSVLINRFKRVRARAGAVAGSIMDTDDQKYWQIAFNGKLYRRTRLVANNADDTQIFLIISMEML
jgi:hypothetical protein